MCAVLWETLPPLARLSTSSENWRPLILRDFTSLFSECGDPSERLSAHLDSRRDSHEAEVSYVHSATQPPVRQSLSTKRITSHDGIADGMLSIWHTWT